MERVPGTSLCTTNKLLIENKKPKDSQTRLKAINVEKKSKGGFEMRFGRVRIIYLGGVWRKQL